MVHEKTRVTDCLLSKSDTIENQLNKNDFYEPLCGKLMNYVSMMACPKHCQTSWIVLSNGKSNLLQKIDSNVLGST